MKITYVLTTSDARAGTEKTFADQAHAMLARGYEVTIASVYRLEDSGFDYGERAQLEYITDLPHAEGPASILIPAEWDNQFCLTTDSAVLEYFKNCTADVVVTSTPALTLFALLACRAEVKIVQEEHRPSMARGRTAVPMLRHSYRTDAIVVLTERNREWLAAQWGERAPRIELIPNALPATGRPQSSGDQKVVMGAGRLVKSKGFSNLVRAFARVADDFPDWKLRIFGEGPYRDHVIGMARDLGVSRQVELFPATDHIEKEWARASIGALASTYEGLPLVLLEARGAGLPLVAYDCETGPREIITHGKDGYLVEQGDVGGFASALRLLMGDDELRARMADGADESLARFAPEVVAQQWDDLFQSLGSQRYSARQQLDVAMGSGATLEALEPLESETAGDQTELADFGVDVGDGEADERGAVEEAEAQDAPASDLEEVATSSADLSELASAMDDSEEETDGRVIECELEDLLPSRARENNRTRLECLFDGSDLRGRPVIQGDNTSWAVRADDREELLSFLCSLNQPQLEIRLYGGRTRLDRDGFSWKRDRTEVSWGNVTRLFLFHHFGVPGTKRFVGYAGGLTITIWEPDERRAGLYRANRVNAEFDLLAPDQFDKPLFVKWRPMHGAPLWYSVEFPVDAVYTWVDGADPSWRARRAQTMGVDDPSRLAGGEIRYRNRDELRYSLRSLQAHAPWVRKIYVVTDEQRPDWLLETDRLKVVHHRDLFPDVSVLPVFNSHAIETVLHKIPGLAEHFLYLNDDMFLVRDQAPENYFTSVGQAKVFVSPTKINDLGSMAQPHEAAGANNRKLIERDFGLTITQGLLHTPYPHKVSVLESLCEKYSEPVDRTRASKFRNEQDVSLVSSFGQFYGYLTGEYVQGGLQVDYVSLGARNMLRKLSEIPHRSLDVLTFGEAEEDPNPDFTQSVAMTFMRSMFQVRAPWEQ